MLINIEKKYCFAVENLYIQLEKIYKDIANKECLNLRNKDITKAILLRLKTYYDTQNKIKRFLNKRYVPAASDFFVEAVVFYLKLLIDQKRKNLTVDSEKQVRRERGALRPDISIWNKDKLVAAIECKTQLGWNRNEWESDFNNREIQLRKDY